MWVLVRSYVSVEADGGGGIYLRLKVIFDGRNYGF